MTGLNIAVLLLVIGIAVLYKGIAMPIHRNKSLGLMMVGGIVTSLGVFTFLVAMAHLVFS